MSFIKEKKFRDQHLPKDWIVLPSKGVIYRKLHRGKEVVYKDSKPKGIKKKGSK